MSDLTSFSFTWLRDQYSFKICGNKCESNKKSPGSLILLKYFMTFHEKTHYISSSQTASSLPRTLCLVSPSATRRIYIVSPMNFEVSQRKWPFWNSYLMYEVPPRRTRRVSCLYCLRRWVMGFSLSAEKQAKSVEWRDTYFSLIKNLNLNCWHIYDSSAPASRRVLNLPSDLKLSCPENFWNN